MSTDLYAYLANGLIASKVLESSLDKGAYRVARAWLTKGIDPQWVETRSELLARVAEQLGAEKMALNELLAPCGSPVCDLLESALPPSVDGTLCAAAAVHVLDIAEQMAVQVYVAELPLLLARADRSGDAARKVGVARHLRG